MLQTTGNVYQSSFGGLCLLIADNEKVEFIPLEPNESFRIHTTTKASFESRYAPLPEYPNIRGAQLCLHYSKVFGATDEVLNYLSKFIDINERDRKRIGDQYEEKGS